MIGAGVSTLLHAGQEVTALAYLSRVLLHLCGFAGAAALVYWVAGR